MKKKITHRLLFIFLVIISCKALTNSSETSLFGQNLEDQTKTYGLIDAELIQINYFNPVNFIICHEAKTARKIAFVDT